MNPRATSELLGLCSHGDIVVGTINAGPTAPPPRRKWMGLTWRSGEGVPQAWREVSIQLGGGVACKGWRRKHRLKAEQFTGQKHSLLPGSVRSRKCTSKMSGFASWRPLSQHAVTLSRGVSTFSSNHTLMFFCGYQSLPDLELSIGPANTH